MQVTSQIDQRGSITQRDLIQQGNLTALKRLCSQAQAKKTEEERSDLLPLRAPYGLMKGLHHEVD